MFLVIEGDGQTATYKVRKERLGNNLLPKMGLSNLNVQLKGLSMQDWVFRLWPGPKTGMFLRS